MKRIVQVLVGAVKKVVSRRRQRALAAAREEGYKQGLSEGERAGAIVAGQVVGHELYLAHERLRQIHALLGPVYVSEDTVECVRALVEEGYALREKVGYLERALLQSQRRTAVLQ